MKFDGKVFFVQSVPFATLEGHELASMILEYRRECGQSDIVQSMTSPEPSLSDLESDEYLETQGVSTRATFSNAATAVAITPGVTNVSASVGPLQFTHLLRMQVDGAEIVRGRTYWRSRQT